MNNDIMVSVTMAAYNHGRFIAQALDSVFMQKTNFNFEVIVGEDCSPAPDKTREILFEYKKKYGDRLILILHDHNVGPRENGFSIEKKIRGKYRCGLEGDDFWTDPLKLQKQFDFLENNPDFSGFGGANCEIDSEGRVTKKRKLSLNKDTVLTLEDYKKRGYTVHVNTIMRKTNLIDYDEKKRLMKRFPTMGDIFVFSFMYTKGPIYVFKDVFLAHRSGESIKSSFSYQQKNKILYYSQMQVDISHALNDYYKGKYDFSFIVVNRIAEVLFAYCFARNTININKKELQEFLEKIPSRIRHKGYLCFIKNTFSRGYSKFYRYICNK